MKKISFLTLLLTLNLLVFSQYQEVFYNIKGEPAIARWIEKDSTYVYSFDKMPENGQYSVEAGNTTLFIDNKPQEGISSGSEYFSTHSDMITNFDPSPELNGDFIQEVSYTLDGKLVAVLQKHSDNLVLYNANDHKLEKIIDLSRNPMDMVVTDSFIFVCCYTAKEILTIDLNTYSVVSSISVDKNPCQLEINSNNSIAYIAFDNEGSGSTKGGIAAYDLQTKDLIFETLDPQIYLYSRGGEYGRLGLRYRKFYLSPDDSKIITQKYELNETGVYSAITGNLLHTYNIGGLGGVGFTLSGDTMFMSAEKFPERFLSLYRINLANLDIIDSIAALPTFFVGVTDLAVNADGTKVLTSGDMLSTQYLFFDFSIHQFQAVQASSIKGGFDLVLVRKERDYAVMFAEGLYDIIDLNTGQLMASSVFGLDYGWEGAISPSGDELFLSDGVCLHYSYAHYGEQMYVVDISNLSNPVTDTTFNAGNAEEADYTNMAWLSEDGRKFVASNKLSHNISIVDVETALTDTLIHYDSISGLKMIPFKDEAISYSEYGENVAILDLDTREFLVKIEVGDVDYLLVSNDGLYAYIIDYTLNSGGFEGMLTKIKLDGENSKIEDQLLVNLQSIRFWNLNTGIVITGVPSLSPDGKYLLSCVRPSEDEYHIGIIDVEQMELIASLPSEQHGYMGFTFTDDSRWALCRCCDYSVPIVYIDGENSSISSSFTTSYYCISAAYNSVNGLFYALQDMYQYNMVDPETGNVINTISTDEKFQYNIKIDNEGNPVVLSASNLIYKDNVYPVIGTTPEMNYNSEQDIIVIAVPGPDKIVTFGDLSVRLPDNQQFGEQKTFDIIPNPANEVAQIRADFYIHSMGLFDMTGKKLLFEEVNGYSSVIDASMLKSGIYLIRLFSDDGSITQKLVIE